MFNSNICIDQFNLSALIFAKICVCVRACVSHTFNSLFTDPNTNHLYPLTYVNALNSNGSIILNEITLVCATVCRYGVTLNSIYKYHRSTNHFVHLGLTSSYQKCVYMIAEAMPHDSTIYLIRIDQPRMYDCIFMFSYISNVVNGYTSAQAIRFTILCKWHTTSNKSNEMHIFFK